MSVVDEEEEWEKAEIFIAGLPEKSVEVSGSSIPMPQRPQYTNESIQNLNRLRIPYPVLTSKTDDIIDDALLSAVVNQRERIPLLALENQILEFVKSSEYSRTFPSFQNSFRRLLLYRVAQRFRLSHSFSDDSSEKGVVLTKTSDIIIPKTLLIDLPYDPNNESMYNTDVSDTNYDGIAQIGGSDSGKDSQKKVIVMKRNVSKDNKSLKKESNSNKQSMSADKARQYAEAKARIFGSDDPEKVELNYAPQLSQESPLTSIHPPVPHAIEDPLDDITLEAHLNKINLSGKSLPYSPPTVTNVATSSGSGKIKKAVERDRGADERDPDFDRRHGPISGQNSRLQPVYEGTSYPGPIPYPGQPPHHGSSGYMYFDYGQSNGYNGARYDTHPPTIQQSWMGGSAPSIANYPAYPNIIGNTPVPMRHARVEDYSSYNTSNLYNSIPQPFIDFGPPPPHYISGVPSIPDNRDKKNSKGNYFSSSEFPPLGR